MMKKLMSLIRRAPKRLSALVVMAAAAVIIPAVTLAWGPDRATFTGANPAPYVTFNSITDNPDVGDERNFVRVREAGTGTYTDNVNLTAGKTYEVMVYYHNNASSGLNASGAGIAKDVALRMQMEASVKASSSTKVSGFITSSNAKPTEVYDSATLTNASAGGMDLSFVAGSAKVTSNGAVNGATLSDKVFSTGTALGYDSLNGKVPGCNQYAGYVIFKIKANQPNFTVSKQVRKVGETTWNKTETVKAGDKLEYLVTYKNTGTTVQNNVVLKDVLPTGISYVAGTTYVANATNPSGLLLDSKSDKVTSTGINIGNYSPGANAYVKYTVQVAANDKLPTCGNNTLTNKATIETDNGNKSDTAAVNVTKTCTVESKFSCKSISITQVDRTNFKFTTAYTVENATFKSVTYTIKNAAGKVVDTKTSTSTSLNYTQTTAGSYTVTATVTFDVNGVTKTATSTACTGCFEVKKPEAKYTCKSLTITQVDRTNVKFAVAYTAENATFKSVTYVIKNAAGATVDTKTSTATTLNYTQATAGTYSVTATVSFTVDGATKTATSAACAGSFKVEKPEAKYTCKSLGITQVDRTNFKFTTAYTAENATFKSVTYVVKNAAGTVVDTKTSTSTTLNYAQATAGAYTVTATVTFDVYGDTKTATSTACAGSFKVEKPESKYTCKSLGITQVDRTNFKFTTAYTAENATFKSVTYVIKNAAGTTVDTKTSTATTLNYTQATAGKYTVTATVTFDVDGATKTATSAACAGKFEVKPEDKDIQVCELSTKKIVTIKESAFDTDKYSKNLKDCEEVVKDIEVCELSTKKIVTIKETDFDAEKYSKNLKDCEEVVVEKIKVCDLTSKQIVEIDETAFDDTKYSKDLTKCEETPEELPHTGMTENIVAIVGLGALTTSAAYYVASRRALNQ